MQIMIVVGTRPEAIKMAPVIKALQKEPGINSVVCSTGQHREMLNQALDIFDIKADFDLGLMQPSQELNGLTSRIFASFDEILHSEKPDIVLTHGDTTTAFAASVACFHRKIAVGHVEAGLRTYDFLRPFPEEMNRRIVDLISTYHFAPTELARKNLLAERLMSERILVTGNTIVDALLYIVAKIECDLPLQRRLERTFSFLLSSRKLVLVTGHRRESFGPGFERICQALARIAKRNDVEIVYPVHLNPNVLGPVSRMLSGFPCIHLIEPTDYLAFVYLLSRAAVVITDSGGVQEEGVSLGKPVLVLREVTERPEGIEAGLAYLVGTDPDLICTNFDRVIKEGHALGPRSGPSVYGDGTAAHRIVSELTRSDIRPASVN